MSGLKTISPIDGSVYVERAFASGSEIQQTLERAKTAQKQWQATSIEERAAYCRKAVEAFVAKRDEIGKEICWQMGRPIRYAAGEVAGFEERALHMIAIAEEALAPVSLPEKQDFERWIQREPLGTVFVVAPWNYPYLTAVNAIMPAIMAGNTVVLKHSAQTPLCAERIAEAFAAAGLPEGVFQYLHLSHEATEQVMQSPVVDYVAFTGSVAGGRMVEQAIAGRFIGAGLELGGKDPAYVRADADIHHAVETTIDGAFFNSGQSCCGIERIYVHEDLYEAFVEKAVALVGTYKLGRSDDDEVTLGPVVKASAAEFVREQIREAVEQGAVAHINLGDFPLDKPGTTYLAPQVLTNVNHTMRIMTEESFGPVVGIQKVSSDEEAIALMNDSEYGLTASVFTQDIEAGIAIGQQVETGTFFLNRCDYLDPALAWTGVKNSGRGCTLSKLGYESLTRPKSFHIKKN
ncbi:aldehyde dehydrogenase family protein [Parendozoicomonas haliclonae]|uniref:Succinate semialdehyde dehydrogenase [NAD(P)+] Sad n=1 Tax=Parendozoicomonas haliclonae TaxID=1960125 RepID=A0A1X7AFW5_9GAMM|nr:aldehyde dehydrogenase family protein [Parendozoicomonas haliclonae]SMA38703.1 Succinate semialdehyde dehydrogenase [NAD(P)+] Sad [Parendozoicomonas haliclonae]